jgi:hypothetical protein
MPHALISPDPALSPRHALVADVLLGGAVGTLFGLLVGLSGSTAVAAVAAVATALAGAVLVLRGSERAVRPLRAGTLAVTALASLLVGTWLERHGTLGPTPADDVAAWRKAGLGGRDARLVTAAMWTDGKAELMPMSPRRQVRELMQAGLSREQALVHLGLVKETAQKKRRTDAEYCADLERRKYAPNDELKSWKRRGGAWAGAAKWVESHVSCQGRAEAVTRLRALACEPQ